MALGRSQVYGVADSECSPEAAEGRGAAVATVVGQTKILRCSGFDVRECGRSCGNPRI
jgi:hypothetical protein